MMNGYTYYQHKHLRDGYRWSCTQMGSRSCRGFLHVDKHQQVVRAHTEHTHHPSTYFLEKIRQKYARTVKDNKSSSDEESANNTGFVKIENVQGRFCVRPNGRKVLCVGDYVFYKHATSKRSSDRWTCVFCTGKSKCKAFLIIDSNMKIYDANLIHSHLPDKNYEIKDGILTKKDPNLSNKDEDTVASDVPGKEHPQPSIKNKERKSSEYSNDSQKNNQKVQANSQPSNKNLERRDSEFSNNSQNNTQKVQNKCNDEIKTVDLSDSDEIDQSPSVDKESDSKNIIIINDDKKEYMKQEKKDLTVYLSDDDIQTCADDDRSNDSKDTVIICLKQDDEKKMVKQEDIQNENDAKDVIDLSDVDVIGQYRNEIIHDLIDSFD